MRDLLLRLFSEPVLLDERCLVAAQPMILRMIAGHEVSPDAVLAALNIRPTATIVSACGPQAPAGDADYQVVGSTAVIKVWGLLDRTDPTRMTWDGPVRIGTGYERIQRTMTAAAADEKVQSIALLINSPGGFVRGIQEAASSIAGAAAVSRSGGKPVVAIAPDLMASAALWIGTQADRVYAGPGAWIGSLGVRVDVLDATKMLDEWGLKVTTIKSGKYKDLGSPFRTMTDDDRGKLQDEVNTYFAQFRGGVRSGRRMTDEQVEAVSSGEGFIGQRAVDVRLADAVKPSVSAVLTELNEKTTVGGRKGPPTATTGVGDPKAAADVPSYPVSTARSASMTPEEIAAKEAAEKQAAEKKAADERAAAALKAAAGTPSTAGQIGEAAAAAATQAVTNERRRVQGIVAACSPFAHVAAVAAFQAQALVNPDVTPEAAKEKVAALAGQASPPTGTISVGAEGWTREKDGLVSAMIAKGQPAITQRLRSGGPLAEATAQAMGYASAAEFNATLKTASAAGLLGMSLRDVAARCLTAAGGRADTSRNPEQLFQALCNPIAFLGGAQAAAAGHTSSDFPLLLENVMNKTLLAPFGEVAVVWDKIAAIGTSGDFKVAKTYRLSEAGNMEMIPEGKTPREQSFAERAEGVQLDSFGARCGFTFQMFMNDDLGAFTRIPQLYGESTARVPEDKVIGIITANPLMSDNKNLYHTDHKNLLGAAALSGAALEAAIEAVQNQRGMNKDKPFLSLEPRWLLVPTTLQWTARKLFKDSVKPGGTNNESNTVAGMAEPLVSPRLNANSTTAWYLFTDPVRARALQVNFLNGQRTPTVTRITDGSSLKIMWEFVFHCGAAPVDFEGTTKNPGA